MCASPHLAPCNNLLKGDFFIFNEKFVSLRRWNGKLHIEQVLRICLRHWWFSQCRVACGLLIVVATMKTTSVPRTPLPMRANGCRVTVLSATPRISSPLPQSILSIAPSSQLWSAKCRYSQLLRQTTSSSYLRSEDLLVYRKTILNLRR